MVINTNISAMQSAKMLADSTSKLQKSLARLSSGSKIVSPEDDAAGLAVSTRFDAQINRVQAADANVNNAVSFSQTQDGYLQQVGNALNRMSELTMMSQDVTKTDSDRSLYQAEFSTLQSYVTDIAGKQFNGVTLFSSTALNVTTDSEATTFAMGAINMADAAITGATSTATSVATAAGAASALTSVETAINKVSTYRATVGANVARLTYTNDQLSVLQSNLSAANSQIKDVDVAEESTQYARYNILVQSGTAMLAQANSLPQSVLRLLQ
jgi:flagellin